MIYVYGVVTNTEDMKGFDGEVTIMKGVAYGRRWRDSDRRQWEVG